MLDDDVDDDDGLYKHLTYTVPTLDTPPRRHKVYTKKKKRKSPSIYKPIKRNTSKTHINPKQTDLTLNKHITRRILRTPSLKNVAC